MTFADPKRSLDDLAWARIVDAVASRCRGPLATRCDVPINVTPEGALIAGKETREVMTLLEAGETLPLDGVREVGPLLKRIDRNGSLEAPELRDVKLSLQAARALRRFLSSHKDELPTLRNACPLDPTLDHLHEELAACIESDGTLADHASPELRRLRTETANLRARIVARLEQLLLKHEDIIQDRFHTLREGRYVVPVRRDAHEKLQGIVHGTSASGATVFVEPRALVAQGNRLKMAQAEQLREEARILADLSELVRERLPEVRAAMDALDHADLRQASARLGIDLGGRVLEAPEVGDADVCLQNARHPVLLLEGVDVVPCDLELRGGEGLVLSGPNAGGKTVALKTLGLSALMHRAGLPVCADEGSRCGFFGPVLTDVGDEQSLHKNLSTFSAHISNVASILEQSRPGALVLLDEVATGTDPAEGSALACAIIDALCRAGAAVAVTTHYEALKAMATTDARLANAAVGFDVERMLPTFELHHGTPGTSSALAVAKRFGIPTKILETARAVLPEQSRTFDELVQRLEEQRRELAIEKASLAEESAALAAARRAVKDRLKSLESKGKAAVDELSKKVLDDLHHARKELRRLRKDLRKKQDAEALEQAQRRLDAQRDQVAQLRPQAPTPEGPALKDVQVGQQVWVDRLRSTGKVLEIDKKKARVQAGPLKLWVKMNELRAANVPPVTKSKGSRNTSSNDSSRKGASPQHSGNTLDVRGLRVDDALAMTESFLDRAYGAEESTAYIVHGIGTGALRDALRAQLRANKQYVASFRGGNTEEGGDRLTIVTLK